MKPRTRDIVILVAGLAVLLAAALGGYAAVRARAQGSGASQVLAPVPKPTPAPSRAPPSRSTSAGRSARRVGPVTVYTRPSTSAPVKTKLGKVNQNGYPTLVLVDSTKEAGDEVWYRVYVADASQREPRLDTRGQAGLLHDLGQDHHRPLRAQAQRVPPRRPGRHLPGRRRQARPRHADGLLLHQPEAAAAVAGRSLRRARHSASARSSPSCPTGSRAGRWPSTAPTRTT